MRQGYGEIRSRFAYQTSRWHSTCGLHAWADCAGHSGIRSEAMLAVRSQLPRKRKASARQLAAAGHSSDDNCFDGKMCCLFSAVPLRVDFMINAARQHLNSLIAFTSIAFCSIGWRYAVLNHNNACHAPSPAESLVDGYNRDELDTLACLQHMAEFVEVRSSTLSSESSKLACSDLQ